MLAELGEEDLFDADIELLVKGGVAALCFGIILWYCNACLYACCAE